MQFRASRFWLALVCAQLICSLPAKAQNVTVSPTSLSFANQAEGTTSASKNVTLKNGQKTTITIASISTGASDYKITTTCPVSPATLASGASCTIATAFSPTATGTRTGTLKITDSGTSSPQTVPLTGTGAAPILVSISLTPGLPSIIAGATQQFKATGTYSNGSTQDLTSTANWSSSSATVATITSVGLATGKSQGTATIKAASGVITGSATLTVAPPVLTSLAVTPSTTSVVAGKTRQFTATGTYSNGSKQTLTGVQWSSSSAAVATIDSAGLATSSTQGSATISATMGSITGSATLTVTAPALTSISVTPAATSILTGKNQQFTATGTYTNGTTQDLTGTAKWSSSTTSVATISATGLATGRGQGTTTIQALAGAITGSTSLTVAATVLTSISVTPAAPTIAAGKTQQFAATGTYDNGSTKTLTSTVQWSSSAAAVATVNSSGLATSSAQGTATITATSGSITGSATLKVNPPVLISISVTPAPAAVAAGNTRQFAATGTYSDGSTKNLTAAAHWASSATAVATVASGGLATGITQGSVTITATSGTISGSSVLTVNPPVLTSISISPGSPSIAKGTNQQFTAIGTYSDGSTQALASGVSWDASPASVATIDGSGLATGAGSGTATIMATSGSFSASASLSVGGPTLVSLSVSATAGSLSFALGTSQQFAATGTYTDGSTLDLTNSASWNTADGAIATVNGQGLATSVAIGNTRITATVGAIAGSATLIVTPAVLLSIAVTPAIPSIPLGTTQPFMATGTFTDGSMQNITGTVQWSSDTPAVATISNDATSAGVASSASQGTAIIMASAGSVTGSSTLTVTSAVMISVAVTPTNPALPLGTSQQFTATATFSDNTTQDLTSIATWSSDTPSTVTITQTGMASTLRTGTAAITASAGNLSGSTTVMVTAAVPISIAISPPSSTIPLGMTQSFTAIGTFSDGTTEDVTQSGHWSSSVPEVATISNTSDTAGLASTIATGATTIGVSLVGVSASAQLTVNPAALASIAITPQTPAIALGTTQQFAATGTYTNGTSQDVTSIVSWTTSDATIAIISNSLGSYGLSTSSGQGIATITASSGSVSSSTSLTVNGAALVSISISPTNLSLPVGTSQQLTATGNYTDTSTQDLTLSVVWASDSAAATVGTGGLVSGAAIGTSNVSATSGLISNSAALSVTPSVVTSMTINPGVSSIAKGTTEQFSAIATYSDSSSRDVTQSAIWTSSSLNIASVNSAGLASGAGVGTASISAILGSVTGSASLTVNSASPVSLVVAPTSATLSAGAQIQFSATASYTDGSSQDVTSTVTWTSSNPASATVSNMGLVVTSSAGSSAIQATLGANLSSSGSVAIYARNTFFVAPNGNDSWSGQLAGPNTNGSDGPFASLSRAQFAVRTAPKPATVLLRNGTYYPALTPSSANSYPGTLIFASTDSGTSASAQVTWQNYPGETAVISGGVPANSDPTSGAGLHLHWTNSGNWYQAPLPSALSNNAALQPFESLYYNGQRRLRSRIHDNGTSAFPSMGYFMQNGQCVASPRTPPGQQSPTLASCNLGTFLRVANTIAPTDALGQGCPYEAGIVSGVTVSKCLDRFIYTSTSGGDPITAWQNVSNVYSGNPASPCAQSAGNTYPAGDVELTMFQSWTADIMRVNCVDTADHVIFLAGPTKGGGTVASTDANYNHFGPAIGHRYMIENTWDAFNAAVTPASSQYGITGIWFLDRHATPWILNYIANQNEDPTADTMVMPQLGGPIPGSPAGDYIGGSLISATGLKYVTFQGIGFEADNFYPNSIGFNNDATEEMAAPQAIDCENCQFVTFNAVTVRHTSASGILAGASAATSTCSTGTPLSCVVIENSTFYDIGNSAVRIGHTIKGADTSATVIQQVLVQNNVIQGYSRVFPDGEGIAEGNGNSNQFSYNTISDGYHSGISVCLNGCGPTKTGLSVSGNNIVSSHNLISNVIQGITSDGGALYYNIGSGTASGTGDLIDSNVVHNVTDDYIIDNATTAGVTVVGSAYGGEGIYLDAQSANVTVTNNVVYNLSGHAIALTEGLASSSETQNTFRNNIFAFANLGMLYQQIPWPNGCPATPIKQIDVINNIFYFDRKSTSTPSFSVIQGCRDSCQQAYNTFQNFQGNIYWRTDGQFGADSAAFQVLATQGLNSSNNCKTGPNKSLFFSSQTSASWQTGGTGVPVAMNEDLAPNATASYQPAFTGTGLMTDPPSDYLLDPAQLLPTGFVPDATNQTINTAHSSVPQPATVPATFPTYVYGSTPAKF